MRMGFREIQEIKTHEKLTDDTINEEELGYKQIKPESGITFEEAESFWKNFFENEVQKLA